MSQVVTHSEEFLLEKDVSSVFPLFSPEGEKRWAPGWDYTNLLGSTNLHPDYVFLTDTHDHNAAQAIWIVADYRPNTYYISYYKIEPGQKIGKIEVQCIEQNRTSTLIKATYKYIGLSDSGNRFIEGFTKKFYQEFIGKWRLLLHEYFQNERNPYAKNGVTEVTPAVA